MAYQTYTTDALVCGAYNRNTADRSYLLFTREAGMLFATARSVREERSKQRYALQNFSLVRVSLVKGKSGWRIGSVEAIDSPFARATSRMSRGAVVSVVRLLRRYVHGEEVLPHIFDDVRTVLMRVSREAVVSPEEWVRLCELRLLHTLGYVKADETVAALLETSSVGEAMDYYEPIHAAQIDQLVTTAARVSHL